MIYLDHAATTPVPEEVAHAVYDTLVSGWGNPSSQYPIGKQARDAVAAARETIAAALGCKSEQFVFTSCGSESDNWAVRLALHQNRHAGKHIITTAVEHSAILETCKAHEQEGYSVTYLKPDKNGDITASQVESALRDDTALVTMMLVNNETGCIFPVAEVAQLLKAKKSRALLHTDAVQAFLKIPFRADTLGADLISVSAHKLGAPKGIGGLYLGERIRAPKPLIFGGGQESGLRSGTEATGQIAGFAKAVELRADHLDEKLAHVAAIKAYAEEKLLALTEMRSAPSVANVPVFIIQLVVFGLQSGSSVLISQYWGRGDRESINRVMGIGFMIAGGVSVLFAAILCAFPAQVLYLITDNLTLVELAEPYLRIVGFSYIFNSLSSIYIGMQRSIENPRFGMIVFAISMLCNTLGNYVLIFGKLGLPAFGITGAAVATLLSRVVEFVVAFSYAFRCRTMPLMKHAILRPGMDMLRKFLRYSAPVLINETLWGTGFSMITVIMGHMANSSDLIAAYTLAGNIDKLMTSGVFGIAAAVSVIVGKEIGTGNLKGVYNIGRALCFTAFAFGIVLGLTEYTMFVTLMRPFVMPLFSLSAVAERLCSVMLMCYACAIPLHSFSTTMVVGVLRGGGDVNASLVIDNFPLWCGTLPIMCLLGLVLKVPNEVFCLCLMIEYIIKSPIGLYRLHSGKWIHDITRIDE